MKSAVLLGTALLLAVAGPVEARPGDLSGDSASTRGIIDRYAQCLVKSGRKTLLPIIMEKQDIAGFERWHKRLGGECMFSTGDFYVNAPTSDIRWAIADVLVREDANRQAPSDLSPVAPLSWRADVRSGTNDARTLSISRFGECVVRKDPAATRAVLIADVDSKDEQQKIEALTPALMECLGQGSLKMSPVELRGALAINLYRLNSAARTNHNMTNAGPVPGAGAK